MIETRLKKGYIMVHTLWNISARMTLLCCFSLSAIAADLNQSIDTTQKTHTAGEKSQQKVSTLSTETDELLRQYQKILQQSDYQKSYNIELKQLLKEQDEDIVRLNEQLVDVQITRQQILPFLREMQLTLEQFIELDLPFNKDQRLDGVKSLKDLLSKSSVVISVKFRRVMEAYQAENDYNYDIESYRGALTYEDQVLSVEFLRIGRTALYFQTLDGKKSGYWHIEKKSWQALDEQYNKNIRNALRVASKQLPPTLFEIPLASSGAILEVR
jgi:hypothetical protein